jgi:multidrug efflux pump
MILAIGLVVDDADRRGRERGGEHGGEDLSPLEAAKLTMTQIARRADLDRARCWSRCSCRSRSSAGVTGKLYQQFAVTIAISMVISGIMALTLSPRSPRSSSRASRREEPILPAFERGFEHLRKGLRRRRRTRIQGWPVSHCLGSWASWPGSGSCSRSFRRASSRRGPGLLLVAIVAPDTANLDVVAKLTERVQKIVSADPAVQDVASVAGYSLLDGQVTNNAAVLFASDEAVRGAQGQVAAVVRDDPAAQCAVRRYQGGASRSLLIRRRSPAWARLAASSSTCRTAAPGDVRATGAAVAQFLEKARQRPELTGVSTTYTAATQQLFVDLDRSKAEALGVPVSEAFGTMQAFFGSQIAGQFSAFSRVWWVILQGGRELPHEPVGLRQGVRALQERRDGPAVEPHRHALRRLAQARDALQRLPRGEVHRQPGPGLQLGAGHCRNGGSRARAAR